MMKLREAGIIPLIIALVFVIMLAMVPGPAMSKSTNHPPTKEAVQQEGFKSYGAGQVLLTADIDLPECWHRWTGAANYDAWWTCADYDKGRQTPAKTADYVTQRVVSYKEFTVPAEGALLMDVRLVKDATHNGSLVYDIQRYDIASAKWVPAGWYWQTMVQIENGKQTYATNTQYDLNLLSQDKDGKPWHPELKNFPLYPPGKYRLSAVEATMGAWEWYAPSKGTFTIVFIPNGKPVSVDSDKDGVPDDKDQCSNTPSGIAVDENGCPKKSSESAQPVLKVATLSSSKSIEMKNGLEFKFSEPGAISFPDGQMIVSPNGGTQVTVTDFINTDQEFVYQSRIDANGESFNILVPKDPDWKNWQAFEFTAIHPLGDSVIYRDVMGKISMIAKGDYMPQQGYQCVLVPAGPPKPPEPIYLHSPTTKQYLGNLAGPAIGRKIREHMEDPWTFIKMGGGMAVKYYAGPEAWVAYQIGIRVAPCILGDIPPASGSGINTALHFTPDEYVMMESAGYLLTLEKNAYFVLVQEGLVTRINDSTGQSLDIPGGYAALFCPGTETIPVKIEDLHGAPLTSCENFYAAVKGETKNGSSTGNGSVLPVSSSVLRDYDKSGDSFSFVKGMTCSGCNYNITNEDFFIADRGAQSIIHAFESPGVIDMGNVTLDSIKEAPASGYQDSVAPLEGHTYVFKSRGKYGKIHIDDILQPPVRTVTEYEFKWAYQANGTRSFATGTLTQPPTVPPPSSRGLYENYHGSADIGGDVRMNYWHAQTFTAQSNHLVSSVKLMAYRIGNPGSLIVSLRATDTYGHPAGADLVSGTTSGDALSLATTGEWREVVFPSSYNITGGKKYAIVVRAPGGGGGNVVKWMHDSTTPDYNNGNRESSGDAGATWGSDPGTDYLFEVLGPPSGSTQPPILPSKPPSTPSSNPIMKTISKFCPLSAAYGSPEAPELYVFRQFRDRFLAKNPIGRAFTELYYTAGPAIVEIMSSYEVLKPAVRYGLAQPVALVLNSTVAVWSN